VGEIGYVPGLAVTMVPPGSISNWSAPSAEKCSKVVSPCESTGSVTEAWKSSTGSTTTVMSWDTDPYGFSAV